MALSVSSMLDVAFFQELPEPGHLQVHDLPELLQGQAVEDQDVVHPVKNSGRKWSRRASMIRSFIWASFTASAMYWLPMLLVMTMMVFRKSTVRPWPSVRRPSSRIWSRALKTSGWAFSISSSSTTL